MTRYRRAPLRVCAALAAATAALFAITSHRLSAEPQARALRGSVDEVYADPRDALYSYGPSALERAMLQGTAAFASDISVVSVSYTHLRAHETPEHLVCRLLLE